MRLALSVDSLILESLLGGLGWVSSHIGTYCLLVPRMHMHVHLMSEVARFARSGQHPVPSGSDNRHFFGGFVHYCCEAYGAC